MPNNELQPIQVGDFEISPKDLFDIARAYTQGDSAEEIATKLNIDPDDLVELLQHPEVFEQAITAKRSLLRLMIYGPLTDRLVTIASGAGDTRSQVTAIKFLKELADDGGAKEERDGTVTTNVTNNTMNVIGQLPSGGFDAVIRQVEAAQGTAGFIEADSTEVYDG